MTAGEEEKKENTSAPTTPKEHEAVTQSCIKSLYDLSSSEILTPSSGEYYSVPRDPHLRLRRTLTPSLNVGIPKYTEAQFMLSKSETTGKRIKLHFGVNFDDDGGEKKQFTMDAYAWGASESEATIRIVTGHGISSGVSRLRWHKCGELYSNSTKVRFVALDWHSIDRDVDDETNTEFLTCLPKHIIDVPPNDKGEDLEEIVQMFESEERREWLRKFCGAIAQGICPRSYDDGAKILRSVIEEGLGWGKDDTKFILGLKCWSGGVGLRMLSQIQHNGGADADPFAKNIQGGIIMHPAFHHKQEIADVMSSGIIPTALMCWSKNDPLMPYGLSKWYLDAAAGSDTKVKFVSYETGGHHNFDGTDGLPNFDLEVMKWVEEL